MSKLNKDILFLLFEELQNDSRSLFSCLLVDRLWCETAIPILWRDPWCYEDNINYQKKSSLYHIITFFLPDDIKEFLTSQEIQLSPISNQSPLFDYLTFCRSINMNVIKNIISLGSFSTYNQFLLQQEIYSLFMRKFSEIKYLNMKSIEHQIFYFPEAKTCLESLCELTCDISIASVHFFGLAHICKHIQRFIIINTITIDSNTNVYDGIIKLIEVQKNLRYFEWKDDFSNLEYFNFEDMIKETFLALEKKADTLNHLVISFYQYDNFFSYIPRPEPMNLSKFHKLKTLKINAPAFEFDDQLRKSVYQNLEVFQTNDYIDYSTVNSIIKNSGGHLRKILIKGNGFDDYYWRDDDGDYPNFSRTIYENCRLIEYLPLVFLSSNFVEFEILLKTCQKLKVLSIFMIHMGEENKLKLDEEKLLEYGEKLSKALIEFASNNLRKIKFSQYDFKLSSKTLEFLLENWRGRNVLSIITSDLDYEKEEYVNVINKYKNDGVVKDFRCEIHSDDYLFDNEMMI